MNLGFLGTGTIATAVVHALAPFEHNILVSERSAANAATLSTRYASVKIATNAEVVSGSDVVFLGLMPDAAREILHRLSFRAEQKVISFIADIPLAELVSLIAPAKAECLVLPFPAIAKTRSPLIAMPHSNLVHDLFSAHDVFTMDSEEEFAAFLSAQAVLSPAAKLVSEAAAWAAAKGADQAKAEEFLRSLVSANLSSSNLDDLLAALNTEGGYNARLREHMAANGTFETLKNGLSKL